MHDPTRRYRGPALALLGLLLALLAWPVVGRLGEPYPNSLQGELTAWFAAMAENMAEHGLLDSKLMPHLDMDPTIPSESHRWYVTHPVLDVVIRARLVQSFGADEWVIRLQGIVGCLGAALALFAWSSRRVSPLAATAAAVGMTMTPLWTDLALLSMHHPMTLALGMSGLVLADRSAGGSRLATIAAFVALFLAMQTDWPGYFFAFVAWLGALRGERADRRRILIGLPVLVAAAALVFWAHVDLWVGRPGLLLERLGGAAGGSPTPSVFTAEGGMRALRDLISGFGWYGIAALLAALAVALGGREGRRWLAPWSALFAIGALNYLAFPTKAPAHDFWGAHALPLVGFSYGICAEVLSEGLRRRLGDLAGWATILALGLVAVALVRTRDPRPEHTPEGAQHRQIADVVRATIPPEDRGLFVTVPIDFNLKLLAAYLRVEVLPLADFEIESARALPEIVDTYLYHLRGKRVLVFVPGGADPAFLAKREALVAFLREKGRPYDHPVATYWFDVTEWVWAKPE
ncbi:MAG: hypothetical protein R3F20_16750 [Planctomycetota bacterium]